jgi:serine/threonine protein kinase
MEIVKSAEGFKKVDGVYKFSYLQVIVRKNGRLYLAKGPRQEPNFSELYDVEPLETEDRGPRVEKSWTVLDSPLDYYIKTPDLWAYSKPDLEQQILREVEICELLKSYPHPNIAFYAGCRSTMGRVSGICFKQYTCTLAEKVNPGHLCKSDFLSTPRLSVDDATLGLDGILAGIHHLHSLNIIHNDVTPSNIFLEEDGIWVLGDFDSCRSNGVSLQGVKRTHGWHDPQVQTASEKNDLDAFKELQKWLIGSSTDDFLFKRG